MVNHDYQKGLLKSSEGALTSQKKQPYLAAVQLLQVDRKSSCNSLQFTLTRELLTTFNYWQQENQLKKKYPKPNGCIETNWNRLGNSLGQFRSVRIRRFIACFPIKLEMARESEQFVQDLALEYIALQLQDWFCCFFVQLVYTSQHPLLGTGENTNTLQKSCQTFGQ